MSQLSDFPQESQDLYNKALDHIPSEDTTYAKLKSVIDKNVDYYVKRNGAFKLISDLVELGLVIKTTNKVGRNSYEYFYRRA